MMEMARSAKTHGSVSDFCQVLVFFFRIQIVFSFHPKWSPGRATFSPHRAKAERKSVSDYMGGHHAGKFDFDPRISGVTSLNYEKSIIDFRRKKAVRGGVAPIEDDGGEAPSWSRRDVGAAGASSAAGAAVRVASSVSIQNEEPSWEPFYASLEREDGGQADPSEAGLVLSPRRGKMAPRGGAAGFSDTCDISVRPKEETGSAIEDTDVSYYLVVRTEMDHWRFKVEAAD